MSQSPPEDYDVTATDQDPEGNIGVSSTREGFVAPGKHGANGMRDHSEGATGSHNIDSGVNAKRKPPKAGYPKGNPRHKEAKYAKGRFSGTPRDED